MMKTGRLKGIFSRTLGLFLIVAGIPLVISTVLVVNTFEKEQKKAVIAALGQIADKKTDEIDAYFNERIDDMVVMASNPESKKSLEEISAVYAKGGLSSALYDGVSKRHSGFYRNYLQISGNYDFFLITARGEIVFTVQKEPDLGTNLVTGAYRKTELARVFNHAKYFLEASVSDLRYYAPSSDDAVFIAAPILDNGRFVGALAVQVSTEKVVSVVSDSTSLGRTGETVLGRLENDMALFVFKRQKLDTGGTFRVRIGSPTAVAMQRAVMGERGRGMALDYSGAPVIAAWSYLPELRWGMVVKIDQAEAFAGINKARNYALSAMAALIGLVFLAAAYLARGIVRPIRDLTAVTRKIAEGDNSVRAAVDGRDEVGMLAESFNAMSDKLRSTLSDLKAAEKELLASRGQLERRVEERTAELKDSNEKLQSEIKERTAAENKLKLAAKVIDNTSEAVIITGPDSVIIDVNQAYTEITGYTRGEVIGAKPSIGKSGRHGPEFYKEMWDDILTTGQWRGEIWDRKKNGTIYPKWLSISTVKDDAGKTAYYAGIFSDITHMKKTEEQLQRMAYYDPLTGLPNRALFRERLTQQIALSNRHGNKTAVLFIDLDRFKIVNDTLGHSFGDKLLEEVAGRLKGCVRETDTVARLGGDEFTVIITDVGHPEYLADVAQKIIAAIGRPVTLGGKSVYVGGTVGISIYPDDGRDAETILKNSDTAMYKAKVRGGGAFHFYTQGMDVQGNARLELESDMRLAIEKDQFTIHYQPFVHLATGALSAMEALIRWDHPEKGFIPPDFFIPLAEETGLIIQIEDIVMKKVSRQIKAWRDAGLVPVPVSVNLSAPQFKQKDLVRKVQSFLEEFGNAPSSIELELIERTLMEDAATAIRMLNGFNELGIRISVDDFGTGYSSLSYLNIFKVYKLKIDRSFIKGLPADSKSVAITRSIINLAQSLGLRTVAEGVETEEQKEFLAKEGCDDMQGYLFSRPVPPDEAAGFLKAKGR